MLLWLEHRPAAAAPIQPLAWKLPYATDVALKKKKKAPRQSKPDVMEEQQGGCKWAREGLEEVMSEGTEGLMPRACGPW